jgi:N-acetylmuramoyl-L-alanine amidase
VSNRTQSYPADYGNIDSLSPRDKVVLRPGDSIDLSFQAAPGGSAQFRFSDGDGFLPMEEQKGRVSGIYKTTYVVKPNDDFDGSDVVYSLKRFDGKKIMGRAGVQLTVQKRRLPRIVALKENSILFTGPDSDYGYNLFCLQGTRLEVSGERQDYLRLALGDSNYGWIKKSAANELPLGAALPKSVSRNLKIDTTPDSTLISIPLQYRHAHRVEYFSEPFVLRLTLFGVIADSDRIRYQAEDSVVKEVVWYQKDPTTCTFDITTKMDNGWGYEVRYEGETMIVEIRHRPPVNPKNNSLKGLKIAVDAGHSKDSFGTIGPWGNTEAQVNLLAAQAVKQELEKRGAEVVMIQDGTKELSLQDRSALAWQSRAHMFISIHADACAEGQDPRELQGYSVHYFQPISRGLAESIHKIYGQKTGIKNQGLWRSNLAVCRPPHMPSILIEQGFLILPEYEELFLSSRHQKITADSVAQGVWEFVQKNIQ